jgi:hypothetical protein
MKNCDVGLVESFLRVPEAGLNNGNENKSSKNSEGRFSADYEAKPSLRIELKPRSHLSPERKLFLTRQRPLEKLDNQKEPKSSEKKSEPENILQIELPELELLAPRKESFDKGIPKIKSNTAKKGDICQPRLFHSQITTTSILNSEKKRGLQGSKSQLVRAENRKDRSQDQKLKSFAEESGNARHHAYNFSSSFKQISERVKHVASPVKINPSNSVERLKLQTKIDLHRSQKAFCKPEQLLEIKSLKPAVKNPISTMNPMLANGQGSQRNSANDDVKLPVDKIKLANGSMFKRSFESDPNKLQFSRRRISSEIKQKASPIETGVPSPEKKTDNKFG